LVIASDAASVRQARVFLDAGGNLGGSSGSGYVSSLFPHGSLFNLFNPNSGSCLNGGDCFTIVLSAIAF